MATFTQLVSGNWRVQVRRKTRYVAETFRRRKDGEECGCKPNAAHIRRIVVWEKPVSAAIERIDQCVASAGVVRSITAAT